MTALYIILLWYFELKHIKITWLKIKAKEKAADWAAFHFLKATQIWSTRPMRYSPVQADQKKPIWAETRPIWQHFLRNTRVSGVHDRIE